MNIYDNHLKRVPISLNNPSIQRDDSKCILCGACKSVCKYAQAVYGNYEIDLEKEPVCINCGQCASVCPTNAITEKYDYKEVMEKLKDKESIVIFQTSPAVRVAIGESFGNESGKNMEGKLVTALKKLGASYVFDTTFGADLTIMEEANELVKRIKENKNLPQFTSCCPAWVKFVEMFHKDLIPNLSTARSPILMQGPIIKTYMAKKLNIDYKKIINVAVAPCTAKKYEITRPQFKAVQEYYNDESIKDMDYVITTNELVLMLKENKVDFNSLEDSSYDNLIGSGSGYIFGNSGGVMEAAIRYAYYILTGEKPNDKLLHFTDVRGIDGIKEASIDINGKMLKLAIISGTANANRIIKKINEEKYDFIEVMACPGGCISGAGQPKIEIPITNTTRNKRMEGLYTKDDSMDLKNCFENEEIIKLYNEFLNQPLSDKSISLLHTYYTDKSDLVKSKVNV